MGLGDDAGGDQPTEDDGDETGEEMQEVGHGEDHLRCFQDRVKIALRTR